MNVGIIIPTHDRPAALGRCLDALRRSTGESKPAILVVDDASSGENVLRNAALCAGAGVRHLLLENNRGPAAARNRGIAELPCAWAAFIDDDVCPDPAWHTELTKAISEAGPGQVGIEGTTGASGDSLWDREVESVSGGLYLTSNIVYRRDALVDAGCFDEGFTGPYCEDQELAARMLRRGTIGFVPAMRVVHQQRTVSAVRYIAGSVRRSALALKSEYRFWNLQRDRYHCFRQGRTFWHTYVRLATRQVVISLRRRRMRDLAAHPLEATVLTASELIEQAAAVCLAPWFIGKYLADDSSTRLAPLEIARTASLWRIPESRVGDVLRVKRNLPAALTFGIRRKPVYRLDQFFKKAGRRAGNDQPQVLIRIDDVFYQNRDDVARMCAIMKTARIPFLAAVPGKDLCDAGGQGCTRDIEESGGEIGLHGFEHSGTFGPFQSEMLQMDFPSIESRINKVRRGCDGCLPKIFIPPFNAVCWDQLLFLARHFRVITGGPETMRFADRRVGPVALPNDAWYFPALQPFYGRARDLISQKIPLTVRTIRGVVCLSFHLQDEAADDFVSLAALVTQLREFIVPWKRLAG